MSAGPSPLEICKDDPEAILLFSRVRLSRNLEGHRFWPVASLSEQDTTFVELESFRANFFPQLLLLADASSPRKQLELLAERLEIPNALCTRSGGAWSAFQEEGGQRGLFLNDEDHLRLWARRPGCDLLACLEDISDWEALAREHLLLARDPHWGWKTWNPAILGSGLQAMVSVFLPALRWTRRLSQVREGLDAVGFFLQPLSDVEDEDIALQAVGNRIALGATEAELAARLEELAHRLREEERRALEDLVQEREAELRDAVFRSDALLGACSLLSREESLRRLELCALGSRLGWISEGRAALAAFLHLATGKAHLENMAGAVANEAHPQLDDLRASAIVKAWKVGAG